MIERSLGPDNVVLTTILSHSQHDFVWNAVALQIAQPLSWSSPALPRFMRCSHDHMLFLKQSGFWGIRRVDLVPAEEMDPLCLLFS